MHGSGTERLRSRLYLFNCVLATVGWGVCFAFMMVSCQAYSKDLFHISMLQQILQSATLRADGACVTHDAPAAGAPSHMAAAMLIG